MKRSLYKYTDFILENIDNNSFVSRGGDGGDTFTNNPRKDEIREKHRRNAIGSNNNMYGLPLEEYPSHKAKLRGEHWNFSSTLISMIGRINLKIEKMRLENFLKHLRKIKINFHKK